MIKYPKIKRLSTLNIIHHQRFDYEFNFFRTDFVGEGGSGKSLISDLLQLIFVGTGAFHSPTQSAEKRLPKTMVLKTSGRGTDFGYAFLNIETEENQFIVIGIYIESTGASQMFIIQNGDDFSEETKLTPFNRLISVDDFIDNKSILPLEQLKDHILTSLGCTCVSWSTTSKYHKILCNNQNNIIPVDISKNDKILKNYSKIIQAFSRESLDISKSDKLKDFLFGDEAEKRFEKQFIDAVNELTSDVTTYKENSKEIEKLTKKHNDLVELLDKKEEKEALEKEFLIAKFNFLSKQLLSQKKEVVTTLENFYKSETNLSFLKTLAENKVEKLSSELEKINDDFNKTFAAQDKLDKDVKKIKDFIKWLTLLNCSKEDIIIKYQSYHKSKEKIDKINTLKQLLKAKSLLYFFESKVWNKEIEVNLQKEIDALTKEIKDKERINSIYNIENKHSLAYWAINIDRKLTIEEESVLFNYHESLIVDEPMNIKEKYIPKPNDLFGNLKIYKKTNDGFWLGLNGIKEFITLIPEPIFNSLNKEEIKTFFKRQNITLEDEIKKLKEKRIKVSGLQDIIKELDNPKEYITAWNSKDTINDTETHEFYKLDLKELKVHASLFEKSEKVYDDFSIASKKHKEVDKNRIKLTTLKSNLDEKLNDFPKVEYPQNLSDIEKKFQFTNNGTGFNLEIKEILKNTSNYFKGFQVCLYEQSKYNKPSIKLNELNGYIDDIEKELKELSDKYFIAFRKNIETEEYSKKEVTESLIEQLNQDLGNKRNAYIGNYNTVAGNHMENNFSRYENSGDFMGLCEEILPPEIFSQGETLDRDIIEKIDKRLKDINIKNQELNGRKLLRLSSIIDEVNSEVSNQLYYVRRIKNFLNDDNKTITGNHKAYLKQDFNKSYPRLWMQDFVEAIGKESALGLGKNLLEDLKPFSKGLEKFVSLEDKMIAAFHRCGGSKNTRPTYKQLLNPKSYYDLKFSIESNKGKNAGSTSQTYSAIALLCIARLSLIESHNSNLSKTKPGIRFMPIDEAEGLGSNFDMLYEIAKNNDYQLLSLSISPNKVNKESQNIYLLQNNLEEDTKVNYPPVPIFMGSN
ncbi:V-type ATP synthase subunit I domain-containing protein [Tenacibaculum maritimum]|uniref:DNA repair protein Rad50 n=1 Tax=Tenacibaculum maritimum TaxID=107401 RepID=UPI0012E68D73|nr:DNA repair protein Rad50 [Tenacibaculum maritimum]CAA0218255.1 conserved hypothetical protein [Tenacibaculum maritimum]